MTELVALHAQRAQYREAVAQLRSKLFLLFDIKCRVLCVMPHPAAGIPWMWPHQKGIMTYQSLLKAAAVLSRSVRVCVIHVHALHVLRLPNLAHILLGLHVLRLPNLVHILLGLWTLVNTCKSGTASCIATDLRVPFGNGHVVCSKESEDWREKGSNQITMAKVKI
jgi:hypothetical protein